MELLTAIWVAVGFVVVIFGLTVIIREYSTFNSKSDFILTLLLFVVLIIVGSWILFTPKISSPVKQTWLKDKLVLVVGGGAIGFYDGAFGPGTGAFLIALFVGALGKQYLAASAGAKIVNLATNLGAVIIFAITGSIIWSLALVMAFANFAGGIFGAKTAIGKGSNFVKIIVATVTFASAVRLAIQIWG
jgi:uncharacterized membrane protein YfcA